MFQKIVDIIVSLFKYLADRQLINLGYNQAKYDILQQKEEQHEKIENIVRIVDSMSDNDIERLLDIKITNKRKYL